MTRKTQAAELHKRIQEGPAFDAFTFASRNDGKPLTHEDAARIARDYYRRWASTWILPDVEHLVPELRKRSE